jgi:SulP family sulfate permease
MVGLYVALMVGLINSAVGLNDFWCYWCNGCGYGRTCCPTWVAVFIRSDYLAGLLQLLFGIFKLSKFIRLVPYPVMLGFVNGLAIVIFLAQLGQFKVLDGLGDLV